MKTATEIVLVVDESGSMAHLRKDTIGSVNAFIEEQKAVPGDAFIQIVTFSDTFKVIRDRENVRAVRPLTAEDYSPNGSTALVDTLINRIDALGADLATIKESERPEKVVFVILTDGEENSSKAPIKDAADRIKKQTDVYKWTFLYLGAGLAAFTQGSLLGIGSGFVGTYNNTSGGTQAAFSVVSASVCSLRSDGSAEYTSAQRDHLTTS